MLIINKTILNDLDYELGGPVVRLQSMQSLLLISIHNQVSKNKFSPHSKGKIM